MCTSQCTRWSWLDLWYATVHALIISLSLSLSPSLSLSLSLSLSCRYSYICYIMMCHQTLLKDKQQQFQQQLKSLKTSFPVPPDCAKRGVCILHQDAYMLLNPLSHSLSLSHTHTLSLSLSVLIWPVYVCVQLLKLIHCKVQPRPAAGPVDRPNLRQYVLRGLLGLFDLLGLYTGDCQGYGGLLGLLITTIQSYHTHILSLSPLYFFLFFPFDLWFVICVICVICDGCDW